MNYEEEGSEVEFLRQGVAAYQRLIQVYCVGVKDARSYQTVTNNNHAADVFQWERKARRREAGLE